MQDEAVYLAWYLSILLSLIMGAFLAIRSVYRFKDWRNGENDAIWPFISLTVGGAAAFVYAFGMIVFIFVDEYDVFGNTLTILFILGIIALGFSAFTLFRKWRELK